MGFALRHIEEAPPSMTRLPDHQPHRDVVIIGTSRDDLYSTAYKYHSRVVGVLLAAGGTDGEGLCIVQQPEEAQDTLMPYHSLRDDHSASIEPSGWTYSIPMYSSPSIWSGRSARDGYRVTTNSGRTMRWRGSRPSRIEPNLKPEVLLWQWHLEGEAYRESSGVANRQQVETSGIFLEPASGIEPPTCGLRNRPGQFLKCSVYQMVPPF